MSEYDERRNVEQVEQPPDKPMKKRFGFSIVVWFFVLTGLIAATGNLFAKTVERLGQWVEFDKQVFGFGHAPGELLSQGTISLFQRMQQFSNPAVFWLSIAFVWLVLFAPIPMMMRERRKITANLWGIAGAGMLLMVCLFFYFSGWMSPNWQYAAKYEINEVPVASKVDEYVQRIGADELEVEEADKLLVMLGFVHEAAAFELHPRPEEAKEELIKITGDESYKPLSRLMAAAAFRRMMDEEEVKVQKTL